jgi:GNAT superfamily N-acetyltransferase
VDHDRPSAASKERTLSQGPWGKSREHIAGLAFTPVQLRGAFRGPFAALVNSSLALLEDEGRPAREAGAIAAQRQRLFRRLQQGEHAVLLGTGPSFAGHAQWVKEGPALRLRELRIAPARRREGLGAALLSWLLQTYPNMPVHVQVLAPNRAGHAFWEAQRHLHPQLCLEVVESAPPLG